MTNALASRFSTPNTVRFAEQRHNQRDLIPVSIARHGIQCFPSIEKVLTSGGDAPAVDGILLIGGEFPGNWWKRSAARR